MHHLEGIRNGTVSLAFRKWKKPAVKKGSLIKTAIGQVEIVDVTAVSMDDITAQDALEAGSEGLDELVGFLQGIDEGEVYRIALRYHSPDPRVALRNRADLSDEEVHVLKQKLARLDKSGKSGPWTLKTLKLIAEHPHRRAKDLSAMAGREMMAFKLDVRKLKNLGLTISHEVGYTLSPRGERLLELLSKNGGR